MSSSKSNSNSKTKSKCNPTQNAWVKFTPAKGDNVADIEYYDSGSCKHSWTPSPVPWNTKSTLHLHRAGGSDFTFHAISFWGKYENGDRATEVVRSFTEDSGGDATFQGDTYVEDVSVKDNLIQATVCNCNDPDGGSVSFQVTIDTGDKFLTSIDPECKLRPQVG